MNGKDLENQVKLYAFQPKGHGQDSAFVMAKSKEEAIEFIIRSSELPENCYDEVPANIGFIDTDYYEVSELNYGEVVFNENS